MQRRARTRQLIELGGLVHKAGLVDLTNDDRAMLYGALLSLAAQVAEASPGDPRPLWKRRGHRAFEAEEQAAQENAANEAGEAQAGRVGPGSAG
ncbi:conjugal transfer protein TraD [Rhizorhabdus argentea]|uniref:conjugal transfer protein TraD n=1 Tax=Rhizorhabdus argentea TaxID=1387174 RepID=UPI0030EEC040